MKNTILKLTLPLLLFTIFTTSCSNSDDDNLIPVPTPINEDNWKLNDFIYSRTSSTQTSSNYTNGNPFTIINIQSNINQSNTPFIASNLQISFNTSTTGNYTIKSENTTVTDDDLKYMDIQCVVINGSGNTAIYKSIDTNKTATVSQIEGKYVINVPETISLTRTSNNGFNEAPDTFVFKCNKVR
jgi:hypothetical protein